MDYKPQNPEYPQQGPPQYQQAPWPQQPPPQYQPPSGPQQPPQYQPPPWPQQPPQYQQSPWQQGQLIPRSNKQWGTALILFFFLGTLGVHRFYAGKIVTGILQLLTFGGFGIWTFIDYIILITGEFTDSNGLPLYRRTINGGNKGWITTAFLCAFLGTFGVHRFYVGKVGTGIFQLLTFGGFGIWTFIDYIIILMGEFKDSNGMLLNRPK